MRRYVVDSGSTVGGVFIETALQHLAQLVVLLCGIALLIDGRIVVVAGAIGHESGIVGSCPLAKRCASVGHIEGEGDVMLHHGAYATHHGFGRAFLMGLSPSVKPSAPVLRAHERHVGAQLLEATELVVDVGTCTEVHRPYEVVEGVELEV